MLPTALVMCVCVGGKRLILGLLFFATARIRRPPGARTGSRQFQAEVRAEEGGHQRPGAAVEVRSGPGGAGAPRRHAQLPRLFLLTGKTPKTFTPWRNSSQRIPWWTRIRPNRILFPPKSNVFVPFLSFQTLDVVFEALEGFFFLVQSGCTVPLALRSSLSKHLPSADTMALKIDVDELENSHGATYVRKKAAKVTGENPPKEAG